jgi:hypothetical protein
MDWFTLSIIFAALLLAFYAVANSGRMAREAMRRQADMERLLVVSRMAQSGDPTQQSLAHLVGTMGQPQQAPIPAAPLQRIPIEDQDPVDALGYDLPTSLKG